MSVYVIRQKDMTKHNKPYKTCKTNKKKINKKKYIYINKYYIYIYIHTHICMCVWVWILLKRRHGDNFQLCLW